MVEGGDRVAQPDPLGQLDPWGNAHFIIPYCELYTVHLKMENSKNNETDNKTIEVYDYVSSLRIDFFSPIFINIGKKLNIIHLPKYYFNNFIKNSGWQIPEKRGLDDNTTSTTGLFFKVYRTL